MIQPYYRVVGWSRSKHSIIMGACCFSIELDARFAERTRKFHFTDENQSRFVELIRELTGYKYARATFLDNTGFLRSMAVEGNCACLGVGGSILDTDWSHKRVIEYSGHNVDSKSQAYDL